MCFNVYVHIQEIKKAQSSKMPTYIHIIFFVLQCVAVCCSVLQCVAVCCSVLQCVAVRKNDVYVCRCM